MPGGSALLEKIELLLETREPIKNTTKRSRYTLPTYTRLLAKQQPTDNVTLNSQLDNPAKPLNGSLRVTHAAQNTMHNEAPNVRWSQKHQRAQMHQLQ